MHDQKLQPDELGDKQRCRDDKLTKGEKHFIYQCFTLGEYLFTLHLLTITQSSYHTQLWHV